MRLFPDSRLTGLLFCLSLLGLCRCSLSIEDPESDARKKIEKAVPTTMAALMGRWVADSTYTVDDTRSTSLKAASASLELLTDTTFSQADSSHLAFPASGEGAFSLKGDTLILHPSPSAADTFIARLRFVGNYLELVRTADQRFTFFHKIKPADSAAWESALHRDSLWALSARRSGPGGYRVEPLVRDFSYLSIAKDSMWSDVRRDGIIRLDSGALDRNGSAWTWKASGGERKYAAELIGKDSLRLWPLADGRPDSGYVLYARTPRLRDFDVDMRPLLGHLRSDSLLYQFNRIVNHYGRYYDLILNEDHKASVETNMPGLPDFRSWTLDSGYLSLESPGPITTRFRVSASGASIKLSADSGKAFGASVALYQTRVDPEKFKNAPLERFQDASYFQLRIAGDTTYYFFDENNADGKFEIAAKTDSATLWASLVAVKGQETSQSSQAGFFFAFQGKRSGLGRFTCRSDSTIGLVIRQTNASDPSQAQGLVQGACLIASADSSVADPALDIEGSFRLNRKSAGALVSPLWLP
jgi:hypothetical protein